MMLKMKITAICLLKGIIDPTKVVRTALQDAASIAGLLIHYRSNGCGQT